MYNDVGLAVGYLNFESFYAKASGKALAKNLLKADQMNLQVCGLPNEQLWNGYAKMETSAGNTAEARRVRPHAKAGRCISQR